MERKVYKEIFHLSKNKKMGAKNKCYIKKSLLLSLFLLPISISFVFASHVITTSSGGNSYYVNEDSYYIYNISINNSDITSGENITQVNITITGFSFVSASNGTNSNSANNSFSNTTTVLTWNNSRGLVMNKSVALFWFNATAATPGNYYFIITTLNDTASVTMSNITVQVNDTTKPSVSITSPGNGINYTGTTVNFNATVGDNINVSSCWFTLNNGVTNYTMTLNSSKTGVNYTLLSVAEGKDYTAKFYCNDTSNNVNNTMQVIFTLDNGPSVSVISPEFSQTDMTPGNIAFIFNLTDEHTNNCTLYLNNQLVNFNSSVNYSGRLTTFINQTFRVYNTWNLSCTNVLGNTQSTVTDSFTLSNFVFNGTVRDVNGLLLNNTIVNISIMYMNQNSPPTYIGYYSTTSNANGWFNLSLPTNSSWFYKPVLRHFNSTTNAIDAVGPIIPDFPQAEFSHIHDVNFYLKPAGTINITVINSTGQLIPFNYQIKDTKLGYTIESQWSSYVAQAIVYVPSDRNYSIMVYPNQSFPVSFNWNNFTSSNSYNISTISNYNASTKTVKKQFNTTSQIIRIHGYVNVSGISGFSELTIVPMLLEPGNMVFLEHGTLPYNMSAWMNLADIYNRSTGYYNISLMGPAESQTILLFAIAKNGTQYYGGYKNITVSYGDSLRMFNFTSQYMFGLVGDASNITMFNGNGGSLTNVSLNKKTFNLINESGSIYSGAAHIEVKLDYSSYDAIEFTFMNDVSAGVGSFSVPILNITQGIKEININVQQGASKRLSKTLDQINSNSTIVIKNFQPGDINGGLARNQISVAMYISNSTCDVPNPPSDCSITSTADLTTFNPLSAVIGGGALSFRMGSGNISVHYVNVDLLASGPPDGMFENKNGTNEGSGSFSSAMKFGSNGPTIYDYVLVSMPYKEGSSTVTGLNESSDINMSIPTFYDQDGNGEMNWTIPIWSSSNGTNASVFAANYSHYYNHRNEWQVLMNSFNCTRNVSEFNSSRPCYIDTTNNRIWIRLPHFSGSRPSVTGNLITAATTENDTQEPSGSSGGGSSSTGATTYILNNEQLDDGYTQALKVNEKFKVNVSKEYHYVTVKNITANSASIEVRSTVQSATLIVGETKKFDVNDDGYYEMKVKLNSISGTTASFTIQSVYEKVTEAAATPSPTATLIPNAQPTVPPQTTSTSTNEKNIQGPKASFAANNSLLFFIILVVIVLVIIIGYFILKKMNSKVSNNVKIKRK